MYLVFEIPNTAFKKVFEKVFKYPKITRYLVFYLNANFCVFDTTLKLAFLNYPVVWPTVV